MTLFLPEELWGRTLIASHSKQSRYKHFIFQTEMNEEYAPRMTHAPLYRTSGQVLLVSNPLNFKIINLIVPFHKEKISLLVAIILMNYRINVGREGGNAPCRLRPEACGRRVRPRRHQRARWAFEAH